jgi:hypothetical protein
VIQIWLVDKCKEAQTQVVFVISFTSKNELTGLRRLPDIGEKGRAYKLLFIIGEGLVIRGRNLNERRYKRVVFKISDSGMDKIIIGFEGQFHILGMIVVRLCCIIIMHCKELPQGH